MFFNSFSQMSSRHFLKVEMRLIRDGGSSKAKRKSSNCDVSVLLIPFKFVTID